MNFKSILVLIDSAPHAEARVRLAFDTARQHTGRVTGLYVVRPPSVAADFGYGAAAELFDVMMRDAKQEAATAQRMFERIAAEQDGQGEWRALFESPVPAACLHARYHDLVVMGQHDAAHRTNRVPANFPEAVAIHCGRPTLLVPFGGMPTVPGKHVMVAWDASREAARALADALPMLTRAEQVSVVTVQPDALKRQSDDTSTEDIALFLARHDVAVAVQRVPANGKDVGDALLSCAADIGADLLVMGLYGHSRLRELALGGASRTILSTMTLPVLVSH